MPDTSSDYEEFSAATMDFGSEPVSESNFTLSRFDSLIGFQRWLAGGRNDTGVVDALADDAGSGEAQRSNRTYVLEDATCNGWRNLTNDCDVEQATSPKRRRRGVARNGLRVRRRSSGQDVYVSPKYFEPWVWKGTTRRPYRDHDDDEDEDEGGSTFTYFIVFVVIVVCVVLVVKNKESFSKWITVGRHFYTDFNSVKTHVEGGVKDMINANFDDMSWKYEDRQMPEEEQSFESAVEENDPGVIRHIKDFEEQMKKKPSKFFPGGKKTSILTMNDDDYM